MIRKTIMLSLIGLSLLITPIFARNLSLDQAVSEALNKSSQILTKTLDVESSQIDEDGKYSSLYPTVNLGLTTSRSNAGSTQISGLDPITFEFLSTTNYYVSLTASASLSFSFNPAMITALQTTALQLQNQSITLEKAKSDLALQVKKLYYGILVQEAAVQLQKDNIEYLEETLVNTKAAYENGDIPELKVLQLQSQISAQKATEEKTEIAVTSQKRTLAFLIGSDDITEPLTLTDTLPTTYNDDISTYTLEKAMIASLDLQSTAISKDLLDLQSDILWESTYLPSVTLSASYMPTASNITDWDTYTSPYDAGSISATVSFNLTGLLPGSTAKKNMKKLDISKEQLISGEDTMRTNIILTYSSYVESINEAKRQINLSKENIELSQKSFDLTALSYENGDTSFSDLKSAQLNVSNAKVSLLQSQYSYLSALLDLENQCTQQY